MHISKKGAAILAFLLPALVLAMAFALAGVYPFGQKSLLIADMSSEYVDYFAQLHHQAREGGSLLRSWNMGMGLQMLGLVAFYASSPFLILVLIFPLSSITEAIFLMTLLKVGLCGLLFYVYASKTAPGVASVIRMLFGVAYGLCGYNMVYASNLMWLDGVAFLPLVLLGVEHLLEGKKGPLLVASLVYVFFTSYYIGYMIGLFSFLYLTARYFSKENGFKAYGQLVGKLVVSAAAAGGCCAFLLVPAFLGLKNGQSEMFQVPVSWELYKGLTDFGAKLLPGVYDSLTDAGLPNIYVTVPAVLLAVLYFFCKGIPRREKYIFGVLCGLMVLCLSCNFLDLAWHAFEDPTWYPARYSFVFCFLLLYLGLRAVVALDTLTVSGIMAGGLILDVFFIEIGLRKHTFVQSQHLVIGLLLVALYTVLLAVGKEPKITRWVALACCVLVIGETGYSAYGVVQGLHGHLGYRNRESFLNYKEQIEPATQVAKESGNGVYRIEVEQQRSANGAMAMDYQGISHYSTTTDQALNTLLKKLGYNTGTINELRFAKTTPLTNGLLGIRYVVAEETPGPGYVQTAVVNEMGIYENTCAFPMAYFASGAALDIDEEDIADPFVLQNQLVTALVGGEELFAPLPQEEPILENLERAVKPDYVDYVRKAQGEIGNIIYPLTNPDKLPVYGFLPVYNKKYAKAKVYLGDQEIADKELAYRNNTVLTLGDGEELPLRLAVESSRARIAHSYFYTLNLEEAQLAAQRAMDQAMTITNFTDTLVVGDVVAPEEGILATSFPYDEGWTVEVDGKRAELRKLAGVFLSVELPEGAHHIVMRYSPPGFRAGCVVSVLSFACCVYWFGFRGKRRKTA